MSSSDGPLEKRPPHSRIGPVATRTPPSVGLSYCPALMISDTLALSTGWRRQEARGRRLAGWIRAGGARAGRRAPPAATAVTRAARQASALSASTAYLATKALAWASWPLIIS